MNMAVSIPNFKQNGEIIPFNSVKNKEKFTQGYVQSSQLYRREVYPFLSDAARAVYFELENHINGYHKETAHVSYSQLQGSSLDKARLLSRATIAKGLSELLKQGVITLISKCSRRGNQYRINEVSLVKKQPEFIYSYVNIEYKNLGLAVHLVNRTSSPSEPLAVQLVNTTNINFKDNFKDNKKKDWFDFKKLEKHVLKRNEILGTSITVKQLTDAKWYKYELENFEQYNANNQITDDLKHLYFATWLFKAYAKYEKPSVTENKDAVSKKQTPSDTQKSPVCTDKQKNGSQTPPHPQKPLKTQNNSEERQTGKSKFNLSLDQIRLFARKLCENPSFASKHAQLGEEQKSFLQRIKENLCDCDFVEKHFTDLQAVGYKTYA